MYVRLLEKLATRLTSYGGRWLVEFRAGEILHVSIYVGGGCMHRALVRHFCLMSLVPVVSPKLLAILIGIDSVLVLK